VSWTQEPGRVLRTRKVRSGGGRPERTSGRGRIRRRGKDKETTADDVEDEERLYDLKSALSKDESEVGKVSSAQRREQTSSGSMRGHNAG